MKIALCIGGQPRSLEKGFEYYKKNLLDQYDVDVFCHSWNSPKNDKILELYKPKAHKFEDTPYGEMHDKMYVNTPNATKWPPRFTMSALHSCYQTHVLRTESGINYDWVIKTRYDYALNAFIPFEQLDKGKVYVPHCRMTPARDFCNDQFAFGDSDVMSKYMSTYLYVNIFYDRGVQMIGEDMLSANLKDSGLTGDNLVYVNMNNPFPPGPHNGSWHSLIRDDYEQWTV